MEMKPRALLDAWRESNRRDTVERSAGCRLASSSLLADQGGQVSRKGRGLGLQPSHADEGSQSSLEGRADGWGSAGQTPPHRPSEPRLRLWSPDLRTRPNSAQGKESCRFSGRQPSAMGRLDVSLAVSPVTSRSYCESLLLRLQGAPGVLDVMVSGVRLAQGSPATV